jgi:membrane dipeptidase
MLSRRSVLQTAALTLAAPFINRARFSLFAQSETEYSARTVDLVHRSTVIDMLGLLTLDYRKLSSWEADPNRFRPADFLRLKNSGITVFHPAVGYTGGDIYAESLRDINGWNAFLDAHREQFQRIERAADFQHVKELGKIGILVGQQNSAHFRTVDDVNRFYDLGQRVSQLTYCGNRIGGGCSDPQDHGLSDYGVSVVERMNEIGMAVDISHCGDRTTLDAMGITMVRTFVRSTGQVTMEHVLDHIDHVTRLVGVEHAGIGSDVDLDGRDAPVRPAKRFDLDGIDYARKIYDLTEGLLRRNYSTSDIELILGGNFERALAETWSV